MTPSASLRAMQVSSKVRCAGVHSKQGKVSMRAFVCDSPRYLRVYALLEYL